MKSPSVKFRKSDQALESALRESAATTELPASLHSSIMRAVRASRPKERTSVFRFAMLPRLREFRWLPITGLAALAVIGIWAAIANRAQKTTLPEFSTAFSASQEMVDSLPTVTVGPLSDELDKVNQDVNRTAEFLIATLP